MTRYILINRHSGFIFADTASLDGWDTSDQMPCTACKLFDMSVHNEPGEYSETSRWDAARDYDLYVVDDKFPAIDDGTSKRMINRVTSEGRYATSLIGHDNE